jgi:hypothetical protein
MLITAILGAAASAAPEKDGERKMNPKDKITVRLQKKHLI